MRKAPPVFATSLNIESGCVCVCQEKQQTLGIQSGQKVRSKAPGAGLAGGLLQVSTFSKNVT